MQSTASHTHTRQYQRSTFFGFAFLFLFEFNLIYYDFSLAMWPMWTVRGTIAN